MYTDPGLGSTTFSGPFSTAGKRVGLDLMSDLTANAYSQLVRPVQAALGPEIDHSDEDS